VSLTPGLYLKRAEDSLRAAKLLHFEGYPDFAVSRAYYGMFYLANAFLSEQDLSFSSHKAVIANFGREFAKTEIVPYKFHQYLVQAQELRLLADYEGTQISEEHAITQLERLQEFLIFAKQFFSRSIS